ncbi:carbohydrate ABC transporter permease [Paenibacillus radicis (ex Xue et al. 2023)]|uniref:Carbohydrate ABC transporter permease n=1 Tax=Paenibacillus radicis (ex Xue et al. 2023) TaxID=2972489 RepID=A0ABT1Y9S1_9BACL|nr:carbohydrate ABC transporter permease [Paenibacillus radicis (ex Xue et al. 2023)]MCR8629935.1 carbohydrate ABC transporter permease [Paenibacillus radicis (ex Xue et al. 2023)]
MSTLTANRKSSLGLGTLLGWAIIWVFLLAILIAIVYPVAYTLFGSFKTNFELLNSTNILAETWNWKNYAEAWERANFAQYTWNSLFISVASTVLNIIICSMGAYVLARKAFPGRRLLMWVLAATMFITIGAITFRPLYDMMRAVHMHTSLWSVVLIFVGTHLSFDIFLLERFVKAIPKDLDEAATIDGCGFFGIYWRIILPLLTPGLGVVGLFTFREAWNQYVLPLIFTMTHPEMRPLTVGVISLKYSANAAAEWNLMLAGSMLSMLPILVVYLFANKSFIAGMTSGSVKG